MSDNNSNKNLTQLHFKRVGREFAMQFLFQSDSLESASLDESLSETKEVFWTQVEESEILPMNRIYRKGREFAEQLISGVKENLEKIDSEIERCADSWKLDRMAVVDKNVMRVAAYEMLFSEDVPPIVSINEAIEIAKDFSDEQSAKFINGVLNKLKDSLDRSAR